MDLLPTVQAAVVVMLVAPVTTFAASITGTVKDTAGKVLENVRIDHTGRLVVVTRSDSGVKPSPDEVRTDATGRFHLVTGVPAIVIRKPGYESQRVRITGDKDLQITLTQIQSKSRC